MFQFKSESNLNSCLTYKFFKTCYICEKNIYINKMTLPCGHFFHKKCIKPWGLSYQTCPICKQRILFKQSQGKSFTPYIVCSFR